MRRVLVTGARGKIGAYMVPRLSHRYDLMTTDRVEDTGDENVPYVQADIADFDAFRDLCSGMDTVVHLAANASIRASWEELVTPNLLGVYHVFEAAARARCRRVVYASTINTVNGYPEHLQVTTGMPPLPGNLYGATKAWGEALAGYYAARRGLSVLCIRFGGVCERAMMRRSMQGNGPNERIAFPDALRLIVACIEAPDHTGFAVFHGLSAGRTGKLDMKDTWERLGVTPGGDDSHAAPEGSITHSGSR